MTNMYSLKGKSATFVLTVRDYFDNGVFAPFHKDQNLPFQAFIQNSPDSSYTGFMMRGSDRLKDTSKMNVIIRGRDGRFVSYKQFNDVAGYQGVFDAVDALPNV